MKKRFVLGLTGGIATGKSTVLKEFAQRRIPTLSSDELAHTCLRRGHRCYGQVVRRFGAAILGSRRQIDRKRLGAIVFQNPSERKWLEEQVHPWVIRGIRSFIRKHKGLIVIDIPLLYEVRLQKLVDAVVVVWSSPAVQLNRLRRRNGLSRVEALRRLKAQMPQGDKKRRADHLLSNNGSLGALRSKTKDLIHLIARNA